MENHIHLILLNDLRNMMNINNLNRIIKENINRFLLENMSNEINDIYNGKIQDSDCPFLNKVWGNGFSIAEMLEYDDPDDRIEYASEHLTLIGKGQRRISFILEPNKYILKLSIGNHRWQTKNEYDTTLLMSGRYDMFPRIIYQSRDFTWSICEYARPITDEDCKKILGMPLKSNNNSEPSLQDFQRWAECRGRQDLKNQHFPCGDMYENMFKSNPWLKMLVNLERHCRGDRNLGTDIGHGTGGIGAALGIVKRNGKDAIVVLDGGFIKPFNGLKLAKKYPKTTLPKMENPDFGNNDSW